jgi:hypothetical protein
METDIIKGFPQLSVLINTLSDDQVEDIVNGAKQLIADYEMQLAVNESDILADLDK